MTKKEKLYFVSSYLNGMTAQEWVAYTERLNSEVVDVAVAVKQKSLGGASVGGERADKDPT